MSLNQLVSANTLYTDDRRLNVKLGNIEALNIVGQNVLTRQYQQLTSVVNTGTNAETLIDTFNSIGSNVIPANTLKQGSKIYVKASGFFTYTASQYFNFNTRFNGSRYILNNNFQLTNAYTSGSTFNLEQEILITLGGNLRVYSKVYFKKPSVPPSLTEGPEETFVFTEYNNTSIDLAVDNSFELENLFNLPGGIIQIQDLELSYIA